MAGRGDDRLQALHDGGEPVEAADLVAGLKLRDHDGRAPFVAAAMIASIDGRTTVEGRSKGLGHPADRALLRSLRAGVDAVLVGPSTIAAERYGNLLDPGPRAAREAAGRSRMPTIATVSRRGELPWDAELFADPDVHVVAFGPAGEPPSRPARITVEPATELAAVLARLRDCYDARVVLCEGGPTLLRGLVAADLLDLLFLTVAPLLTAGDAPPLLAGAALEEPAPLVLARVLRADDHAILEYRRPR